MAVIAVSFYDQVLLELLAAIGAALFLGNLLALVRRRREPAGAADLDRAPIGRTVLYLVVGFVVMLWSVGSLVT